ncbi:histidine kinase [candidate division LCP-89 bacterium B3_LCP]|uniref:Histidine kinase n=1 Tax=candidate division LCP-89 bacterium B3_LCP TaxID=2012998 RepID=A0A532V4N2_UNCL8|nr:MAG: histidine kinase [candidate division LCP-89 bacterium B3_LCP]
MHEKVNHIAPEGHPIHTLMTEHAELLGFADELVQKAAALKSYDGYSEASDVIEEIKSLIAKFKDSEKHYLREENVLFPYIDKHGISGPTQVMWTEHDQIRDLKKGFFPLVEDPADCVYTDFVSQAGSFSRALKELLTNHFHKENNILFTMAMDVITGEEWKEISSQFAEIGYCSFSPIADVSEAESGGRTISSNGEMTFATGSVPSNVMEAMLNTLPVEITYIDDEDTVKYFSQSKEMIFTRTKAILGNKVQNCHPQKSVHLVNKIVEAFRDGSKDVAEFWIDLGDKKAYIRYFAVRDENGKYLGCMEVTQDIAPIQKIEGQRRLLDWS